MGNYSPIELLKHFLASITYTHQLSYQSTSIIKSGGLVIGMKFSLPLRRHLSLCLFRLQNLGMREQELIAIILGWILISIAIVGISHLF